jgi:hypothetical protein
MQRSLVFLAAAAVGILVSGCFMSEGPKFPPSSAVTAFGDGGRYGVFTHLGGGRYKRQETFVVRRPPGRSYEVVNEESKVLRISFHDIGGGLLVGQSKPHPDRSAHGYLVLARDGRNMLLHAPQCKEQDEAVLNAFGVERRKPYDCFIDG